VSSLRDAETCNAIKSYEKRKASKKKRQDLQGRILVTRSRQMRMGKQNLLRRTLSTTYWRSGLPAHIRTRLKEAPPERLQQYRCAGRHAFWNQSRDAAQFRIRSCALLVCFGTLHPGLCFGGKSVMKSVRLIGFLHPRFIGWLLETPRLVPDLPCSSCITRVWPWRRAGGLTLFRSAFQSV